MFLPFLNYIQPCLLCQECYIHFPYASPVNEEYVYDSKAKSSASDKEEKSTKEKLDTGLLQSLLGVLTDAHKEQ